MENNMRPYTYRLGLAAAITITLLLATLATFTNTADAQQAQYEPETVESLQFADTDTPAFLYDAPATTCTDAQGFTNYDDDCPDVTWQCPNGITSGALTRYTHQMSYNQLVAGYSALNLMCLEGPIIPNPQPPESVPATTTINGTQYPAPTAIAFTGNNTNTAQLGLALLGAGATLTATARRRRQA